MGRRHSTVGALALVAAFALAGEASAATCAHDGGAANWNDGLSWTCSDGSEHVPGPGDDAIIGAGDRPTVGADPLAEPGSLLIMQTGRIVFANDAALRVGDMTAVAGAITGQGSLTVEDTFHRTSDGESVTNFSVTNEGLGGSAPDLVLDGPATMDGGQLCVGRSDDASPDQPSMAINATFAILDGDRLSVSPFSCTSGPRIRVNAPDGHLIHAADRTSILGTMVVNDGRMTVQDGEVILASNNAGTASNGAYIAAEGATLQYGTCCSEAFAVGPAGRVGGAGTIEVSGRVTLADGATLDPGRLHLLASVLRLHGETPLTLPAVSVTGGSLDSERDLTVTALLASNGSLLGDFTLTVPGGGSFVKTGDGTLFIRNRFIEGAADLVLDADGTIEGGRLCVARTDDADPDSPNLHINQDLTVGSGASAGALGCGSHLTPGYWVNGPDGHLRKTGPGTLSMQNKLGVAGGTLTVAEDQTFTLTNGMTQSAGLTDIAAGGVIATPAGTTTLAGGVLSGAGQISGRLTNSGGSVRPAGTLTVTGAYTQGAAGTLVADVAAAAHDRLAVGGAADLNGALAAVPAAGFDPAPGVAFPVVTSASRTGEFATLTGTRLPAGKRLAIDYPGGPDFGARLIVNAPVDLVVDDCGDPALATVTEVTGNLVVDGVAGCDAIDFPALEEVTGDLAITGNDSAETISLGALTSVTGNLDISGNATTGELDLGSLGQVTGNLEVTDNPTMDAIDMGSLTGVTGDLVLTGNDTGELDLGALGHVTGDLVLETGGTGELDLGDIGVGGDASLDTTGFDAVSGTTADGATTITNAQGEALMRAELPAGAFTAPVPFTLTRLDPAALPAEGTVDPVVGYQLDFGVPTLNSPATLTFEIRTSELDPATRDAFLTALDAGRVTLATKDDAPGSAYQGFPLCPAAGDCVQVERPDPEVVRFTGVTGHFSTWAVAIVTAPGGTPQPPGGGSGSPPPSGGAAAFGPATRVTLRAASARIPRRGPVRLRVANANAFEIGARIAGKTVRRVGRRRVGLAARALRVPAGASRDVALKLPKPLRRRGRLALRVTAAVTDPAGNRRTVSRRVTVRRR